MADKQVAWAEGTKLAVTDADTDGDGHRWKHVRDPKGNVGWVPAEVVTPSWGRNRQ